MSARELLMGTSFRAVLGSGAGAQWTGWGQGASVSRFSSAGAGLSLSGETATGSMGMDFERGRLLTGFAMTHSLERGRRRTVRGPALRHGERGDDDAALCALRALGAGLGVGVGGHGLREASPSTSTADAPERYRADLAMSLAAVGLRGDLVTPAEAGGLALALEGGCVLGAHGIRGGLDAGGGQPRGRAGRREPAAGGARRLAHLRARGRRDADAVAGARGAP